MTRLAIYCLKDRFWMCEWSVCLEHLQTDSDGFVLDDVSVQRSICIVATSSNAMLPPAILNDTLMMTNFKVQPCSFPTPDVFKLSVVMKLHDQMQNTDWVQLNFEAADGTSHLGFFSITD